jgi:hypothetical protein
MEAAVIDELRRAIPTFVGLCGRGKPVKKGRYNKGKRKGEKVTAGMFSTTFISSSSRRAPMVTAVPNSGEKFGDLEAIFSRVSKGE